MTDLSYSTSLVPGTPENVSDVQTMFNEVKTHVNSSGWIDEDNLGAGSVTAAKLAAGTPGSVVASGHASSTSTFSAPSVSTVLELTITGDGATPIWLEFYGNNLVADAATTGTLTIIDTGSPTAYLAEINVLASSFTSAYMKCEVAAFSGSKTFRVRVNRNTGSGNVAVNTTGSGLGTPTAFFRATWGEA